MIEQNLSVAGVNFAFSSMPNDVQRRNKRDFDEIEGELKCKSEEIGRVLE